MKKMDDIKILIEDIRYALRSRIQIKQNSLNQALALQSLETEQPDGSRREYLSNTITELQLEINTLLNYEQQSYGVVNMMKLAAEVTLPEQPVKPRTKLILLTCLVIGGFLGVLVALFLEALSRHRAVA